MKRRSGVSYLITVVLMTLVAVALGTLLYAYFSGWVGSRTGSMGGPVGVLSVEEAYYISSNKSIVIYVRNDGVGTVNIVRYYLTAPNGTVTAGTISSPVSVDPGSTAQVTITLNNPSSGVWAVKLIADDGSSVATTVKV